MTEAGLFERRVWLTARMDGQPDEVDLTVVVSGEGVTPLIWQRVFRAIPHWVDADGRTRGQVALAASRVQIRLSDQGELASHDYENQTPEKPSAVVAFVRRLGFHTHRPGESFEWVCSKQPSLVPPEGSPERYTRKQHDYVREHGGPSYPLEGDQRSTVPSWDTWARYVREYLRLIEGRRNESRRGEEGRSEVGRDELDNWRRDRNGD